MLKGGGHSTRTILLTAALVSFLRACQIGLKQELNLLQGIPRALHLAKLLLFRRLTTSLDGFGCHGSLS